MVPYDKEFDDIRPYYDEEMHDEENTVITIQKVERAWTPWNAKFYNMNHYFNNNKR